MTGRTDLRMREAEEVLPLLALAAAANASPPSSPILYASPSARKAPMPRCAPPSPTSTAAPLGRKYVAYDVSAVNRGAPPLPERKKSTTRYGTMPANTTDSRRKQGIKPRAAGAAAGAVGPRRGEEEALLGAQQHTPDASNQSETESDSDGSCGGSIHSSRTSNSSLQSILRIRSGEYSCRSLKKQASVEFALDTLDADDAGDLEAGERKKGARSCASRCVPRRLTIEEKAALYQVRPDLELTPTAVLLSELEELRRQRQRKLMFSILGATLILLMMIVFYYLVSQM